MTDILFDLDGGFLPGDYAAFLWGGIASMLPWIETVESAGMLPLKGAASKEGLLLPRRAKLALRLPEKFAGDAMALSGRMLDIGGAHLGIGAAKRRPIKAYPTLHAHLVESAGGEADFLGEVMEKLGEMEISCKWICGRRQTLKTGQEIIPGYSLVVHDLKPAGSISLQHKGLGNHRRFGCGIFVPHKTIAGLD